MWTLVVLVLNVLPPTGITVFGFIDEAACLAEAKRFCDGEPGWRCKCIVALSVESSARTLPSELKFDITKQ